MDRELKFTHVAGGAGRRYQFSPSVCATGDGSYHAWLELDDGDCVLETDFGFSRRGRGFLQRPLLVAHAGVAHLLWSERTDDGRWPIAHVAIEDGESTDVEYLTEGNRRPVDPTAASGGGSLLVAYESTYEATGEIRGLWFRDGSWSDERVLSGETADAAHDAAVSLDSDGTAVLAYTAFRNGWYDIEARNFDGGSWSEPATITSDRALAAYPTVGTDADGGAWIGWVSYDGEGMETPYVTHQRRADQHSLFQRDRIVTVAHWDGEDVTTPRYDRSWDPVTDATAASGRVFPAEMGARPALITGDGAVRLAWLGYETEQSRPRVAVSSLADGRWTDPVVTAETYGDAERLHWTRSGEGGILVAAGRDTRKTGWGAPAELSDPDGRCDVGHVELPAAESPGSIDRTSNRRWRHTQRDARNPAVPDGNLSNDAGERLAFLDSHRHTDLSICARAKDGEPALNLRTSRELLGLDALALTDHCYNSDALTQFKTARVDELYNWPGSFVTIPSYEWTGSQTTWDDVHYGHFTVHAFDGDQPLYGTPTWEGSDLDTPGRLWDALAGRDALTIPHHTADARHYFDPDLFGRLSMAPVVEIFQGLRGTCELREGPGATEYADVTDDACYVQSQLADGVEVGFVAGGDHYCVGVGGLWVEELTRAGIYEALRDRRTFATTGTTLALDTRIGATPMGAARHESTDAVDFHVEASVPVGLDRIEVLLDNEVVQAIDPDSESIDATFEVDVDAERDRHWLYCRLSLSNGEVAWSSPTWVATA